MPDEAISSSTQKEMKMKNLLLPLILSLAVLPVHADELSPSKGTDLPPPRVTTPKPPAMPAEAAPAAVVTVPKSTSNWYGNINTGVSRAEIDSGGFNTNGGFANTGSDHDGFKYGFLGLSIGRRLGNNLRLEAEFTGRNSSDFTTNSRDTPTPAFFYGSSAQANSGMLNLFYDHPINSRWSAFVGAGLGAAFVGMEANDGVVKGSGTEANFAWQGMLGAAYDFDKANSLNYGYRYLDAGDADISLSTIGAGAPAGNYEADLTYHDIIVGWRHSF